MPLQATSGAASYDAFGGGIPYIPQYIEDVFSTWLYTGNGSTQTITNGINLAGKGGLVWTKSRSAATNNELVDTNRGAGNLLRTNATSGEVANAASVNSFNSNGFGLTAFAGSNNTSGVDYISWAFRKQQKFFNIVTYVGNGTSQDIAHGLGSIPGCIIVKRTDGTRNWVVQHRSVPAAQTLYIFTSAAATNNAFNSAYPTSATFSVAGTDANALDSTYVAYIFAHNAGGFGLTGNDNVISCESFSSDSGGAVAPIFLGYEPQLILMKVTSGTGDWFIYDTMRGLPIGYGSNLEPNLANAEAADAYQFALNPTGFTVTGGPGASQTFIYIAIRRGPMKVPTDATKVFGVNARTGTGANATVTGSAGVSDAVLIKNRGAAVGDLFASRLTGTGYMETSSTAAEVAAGVTILQANPWDVMDGVKVGTTSTITNASTNTYINYLFDRAPGFMDAVCYTGTASAMTVAHNLAAVPELMIVKGRLGARPWQVYSSVLANTEYLVLNTTDAKATGATRWNSTTPTSSVFTVGSSTDVNANNVGYVAYLFATCPGVSKVGSYTGTGTTLQIDCGFTGGARFVLIKYVSTASWIVWDSARGIVSGNDPYLLLNSTAAEVTSTDYIDTFSAGFEISSTAPAAINASGGTYIFLAIA